MSVTDNTIVWLVLLVATWYMFIRKDDKQQSYALLGSIILSAIAFAGLWVLGDNLLVWIVVIITTIFFIRTIGQYQILDVGGGI